MVYTPQGPTLWVREVALASYQVPGGTTGLPGPRGTYILGTGPPGLGLGVRPATLPWKTFLAAKSQTGIAGWISQRRPLLRPKKMKTELNVCV
jgi:hypothetical protein